MKTAPICQSCSMPMTDDSKFGTEKDGSPSKEFCVYCYQQGEYTNPNATLDEVIEVYAPNWGKWTERPDLAIADAKTEIHEILSKLKRWQKKEEKKNSGCCCCCRRK